MQVLLNNSLKIETICEVTSELAFVIHSLFSIILNKKIEELRIRHTQKARIRGNDTSPEEI